MNVLLLLLASSLAAETPVAPTQTPAAPSVKYRKGKDVNFDELLIQGQLKRPELTVVTGNTAQGTDGLLRLRENFLDQTQNDIGEEIQ